MKIGQTGAMLGRQRHRLAKAEVVALEQARIGGAPLGLVADQVHLLASAAQHLSKALIQRGHAGARIVHEQDDVGFANGKFGLLAHAIFEGAIGAVLVASGIEDLKAQIGNPAFRFAAVARDARRVIHQRDALTDEAVEQGRFADIGAADNSDSHGHGLGVPVYWISVS